MSVTVPDLTLDFVPLYPGEDEETILTRWQGWANEGLDPVQDALIWVDTREGSHWSTVTMPMVRECARIYDLMGSEVPMSGFVLWAWETYLDDLAAVYDVARKAGTAAQGEVLFSGPVGTTIDAGTQVSASPTTEDDPAPLFEVVAAGTIGAGGTVTLTVQAVDVGAAGDVGAGAITAPSTPLPPGVTFTNPDPTLGGEDVESDDALRQRVLDAIKGKGPGTLDDYARWAGGWDGVGRVQVVPLWNGAGTVLVMIADPNGLPLPDAVVTALQADLDPVAGQGHGTAPVGATVTVDTSSLLNINVAATIVFEPGYSWDGFAGTIAVGNQIKAGISRDLLRVAPGGEVVVERLKGITAAWEGVHDVTAFTVNGGAANVPVGLTPPQVPVLSSYTVS